MRFASAEADKQLYLVCKQALEARLDYDFFRQTIHYIGCTYALVCSGEVLSLDVWGEGENAFPKTRLLRFSLNNQTIIYRVGRQRFNKQVSAYLGRLERSFLYAIRDTLGLSLFVGRKPTTKKGVFVYDIAFNNLRSAEYAKTSLRGEFRDMLVCYSQKHLRIKYKQAIDGGETKYAKLPVKGGANDCDCGCIIF